MKNVIMMSILAAAISVSGVAMADDVVVSSQPTTTTTDTLTVQSNADIKQAQTDANKGAADAMPNHNNSFRVGGAVSLATPYGFGLGVNFRLPYMPWLKVAGSGTFNLAPGLMASALIDPIRFPIAPVINLDAGWQSSIKVPGFSNPPTLEWTYENIFGGLALGGSKSDSTRVLLLAGMTHIDGSASNVQGVLPKEGNISLANPTFNGWLPGAKLEVEWLF
jgi:hypothetical protein